ncbi:MAG TPA: hypothetical protein GX692_06695 [Acholeplasmataceae bacterium]|jgi:hypothetical protein|nr:hypothetical protein [Acholeplasmataceae bacterium]
MQELLDRLFSPYKVLLCYKCGSSIYGLSDDDSDKDYTVILEGYDSCNVVKTDDSDFFTYGLPYFEKLKKFDKGCLTYFLVWIDNTLLAKENIVYIDESIKDKLDEFLNIDFKNHFKDWLYRLIAYFGIRLQNYKEEKSLYHLYRVESLIKHYKETGKFEYYFSKENKELAMDLKTNLNMEKHLPRLKEIFSYLLSLYKEEEENGN